MKITPYPHQIEGKAYLLENKGGCLWVEMRGGKTLMTLLFLKEVKAFPALIVGPGHVFQGWEDTLRAAGGSPDKISRLEGTKKKIEKLIKNPNPFLNLMNYTQTWRRDVLNAYPWKAIVLDESIRIGNFTAEVTEYFTANAAKNQDAYKICLSGSPASENIFQLVPQHFWQRNGKICGYEGEEGLNEWIEKNWHYSNVKNNFVPASLKKKKEFLAWNEAVSFQRTLKDLGFTNLICHRIMRLDVPHVVRHHLRNMRIGEMYISVTRGVPVPMTALTKAGFEMSICAGRDPFNNELITYHKQKKILEEWDKESREPFIVFSRLKQPLQVMPELFKKMGGKGVYVDGNTLNKEEIVRDFQEGRLDAIFSQTEALMEGVTLDRAERIYYLNNSFSLNTRVQSQMRGSSIRKKRPTEIIDVVYDDTFEVTVAERLIKKKSMSDEALQRAYTTTILGG